jgi:hypothetical protein
MYTCYKAIGTGKNRDTGAEESYPCVLITDGSGRPWKLSSVRRLEIICDLIEQAGGKPSQIQVLHQNSKGNLVPFCSLDKAGEQHLKRSSTGTSTQPGTVRLPKGVTLG